MTFYVLFARQYDYYRQRGHGETDESGNGVLLFESTEVAEQFLGDIASADKDYEYEVIDIDADVMEEIKEQQESLDTTEYWFYRGDGQYVSTDLD